MLEQEMHNIDEPSAMDSEVMRHDDNKHCEIVGPSLAARPIVQKKVKNEQPMAEVGASSGSPQ